MFEHTCKKIFCFIVFILLSTGAGYSYSGFKLFDWVLAKQGAPLLQGRVQVKNTRENSGCLTGHESRASDLDCCTRSTILCSGSDYCSVEEASLITLEFTQNAPGLEIPPLFAQLFENTQFTTHHRFITRYTHRGRTASAPAHLARMMCYLCCYFCYIGYEYYSQDLLFWNQVERQSSLTEHNVHLPSHVTVESTSLLHTSHYGDGHFSGSSVSQPVADNVTIFDLFMTSSAAQQWLTSNLGSEVGLQLPVIIPELFNTPVDAYIQTMDPVNVEFEGEHSPSHLLMFNLDNGVVQYHLKNHPSGRFFVEVLAIVITVDGFTLTFNTKGYKIRENEIDIQPPPYTAVQSCHCNGACGCSIHRQSK